MRDMGYRIRNCFSLSNIIACFVGAGLAMIGVFAPSAWEVSSGVAQALSFTGIGLLLLGLGLAVYKYVRNPVEKKLKIYSIVNILDAMYERLEVLARQEARRKIDWGAYNKTAAKIIKLVGVAMPTVASVEEARGEVEELEKEMPNILKTFMTKQQEQKIRRIQTISRILDKDGFGLKRSREESRKYVRLKKKLNAFFTDFADVIDDKLRKHIRYCVIFNEASANALLYVQRTADMLSLASNAGITELLTPSLEADMEGFKDDVQEIGRTLRVEVGENIRRLLRKDG